MPLKPKLPKSEAPLAPVPPEILDQFVRQGPISTRSSKSGASRKPLIEGPWAASSRALRAIYTAPRAHVIPFFAFPPDIRRVLYTTNALESVHARLGKIIKTSGHFPTDDTATKLIWLALQNITAPRPPGKTNAASTTTSHIQILTLRSFRFID